MPKKQYLTKSLFNVGRECATRMYYKKQPDYPSTKDSDEFLKSLAKGGMQVGELACMYHPGGTEIKTLNSDEAIAETKPYLERENVTLYEPAIVYDDRFLIRVDVFEKRGNKVDLIEVKAKSWSVEDKFYSSRGGFISDWVPYLFDVAFQYWVMSKAHPEWEITPYLMMADKDSTATLDGLYQRFKVETDERVRYQIVIKEGTTLEDLGEPILKKVNVMEAVQMVLAGEAITKKNQTPLQALPFEDWMNVLAEHANEGKAYPVDIGEYCKNCEFRVPDHKLEEGEKSGFKTCWSQALGWDEDDFSDPHIFDIWNYRKAGKHLAKGQYKIMDLTEDDLPSSQNNLTTQTEAWESKQRQSLQILMQTGGIADDEIILNGLHKEMQNWQYPLYFLDFEGLMLPIPMQKGQRPYQQLAFQFSIHTMEKDGSVHHSYEWIHRERGSDPNVACARELYKALANSPGTVFMYSQYENTIMGILRKSLESDLEDAAERQQLDDFLAGLMKKGDREMVDLLDLIKKYHYHKDFKGSNSIKTVQPVLMNNSAYLEQKYRQPYTGKNFKNYIWYQENAQGRALDPYKLLPPVGFENLPDYDTGDEIAKNEAISDGGAAMMAWARMQFEDVPETEREAVFSALLKYCELDTLSMVMVVEAWREWFE